MDLTTLTFIADIVVVGALVYVLNARRPEARARAQRRAISALRRSCIAWLNANPRTRRAFTRIIREAVALFGGDEARLAKLVGERDESASGCKRVAEAAGVPITLVFDWQEGVFGHPPEEIYSRANAVASIAFVLCVNDPRTAALIPTDERRASYALAGNASEKGRAA